MQPVNARCIMRTNGTEEMIRYPLSMSEIGNRISAEMIDTVKLRNGMVMIVDDAGHAKDLPINHAATALYHSVCRPGIEWVIRGDVAIVPDADYAQ